MRDDNLIYFVPLEQLEEYRDRAIVVRGVQAHEVIQALSGEPPESLAYVQLLDPEVELAPLYTWAEGLPLEVHLCRPLEQMGALYSLVPLMDRHPLRTSIPVLPGFSKAVRVATSLDIPVILNIGQPTSEEVDELIQVLEHYLHDPTCKVSIEFFHSFLVSLRQKDESTIWDIQEDAPDFSVWVDDNGAESPLRTSALWRTDGDIVVTYEHVLTTLSQEGVECRECAHLQKCVGYFKCPDPEYSCELVKVLLDRICEAAQELASDVAGYK